MSTFEVLDSSSDGSFKLDDSFTGICGLVVDDDFEVHAFTLHDALNGAEVEPNIVGVEDLELRVFKR